MLKANLKKIKSAPSTLPRIVVGVGCLFAVAIVATIAWWIYHLPATTATLHLQGNTYHLDVAATPASQQQGLSGRQDLATDAGMLFQYDSEAKRCFWMKDMQFSIDIIWVDASRHVTRLEPALPPRTYPQTYCAEARYVIELHAGEAANTDLMVGQQLTF